MQYKKFLSFINNNETVNSLLKELTVSFKKVIGKINVTNNVNFKIKLKIIDDDEIFIYVYYEKQKLFSCRFTNNGDNVLILYTKYINWYNIDTSAFDNAFEKIEKYTSEIEPFATSEIYTLPLENAYKLKNEFDMYIASSKYNL